MTAEDLPQLLTTAEAAEYLGITEDTLRNWRRADAGPDYAIIGRWIRYLANDIDTWRQADMARARQSTSGKSRPCAATVRSFRTPQPAPLPDLPWRLR